MNTPNSYLKEEISNQSFAEDLETDEIPLFRIMNNASVIRVEDIDQDRTDVIEHHESNVIETCSLATTQSVDEDCLPYLLMYSTYFGGPDSESLGVSTIDSNGSIILAGHTEYPGFPASFVQTSPDSDCYVLKLNVTKRQIEFVTFFGGSSDDRITDIQVDESGNIYLLGNTESSDFPVLNSYQDTIIDSYDMFVVKLNSTGNGLYFSSILGGSNSMSLTRQYMDVDSSGCIYIGGYDTAMGFPIVNPCEEIYNTTPSCFAFKLNETGNGFIFSTPIEYSAIWDVVVDDDRNLILCGRPQVTLPTKNAIDDTFNGKSDGALLKLDSTGSNLIFSTFLGGEEKTTHVR